MAAVAASGFPGGMRRMAAAAAGRLADLAGAATGRLLGWSRSVPGIGGAGLMSYAFWGWHHLMGYGVAALFLLMLDRRL